MNISKAIVRRGGYMRDMQGFAGINTLIEGNHAAQ